ncbi:MAG: nickel pincer cofactor biosynthesis protein LarC [Deltaproteobacteria bacterium]|nr:nickel pincer cofactor biosynthesis protein LarC [Deltaproteobacteria bacterium]
MPEHAHDGHDSHGHAHGAQDVHAHGANPHPHAHGTDPHAYGTDPHGQHAYGTDPHGQHALGHEHPHAGHTHGNHVHAHAHGEHAHYHYAAIREQLLRAPLTEGTRARALDIFDRIARAEAKLHGTTVAEVSFHEVGAIDSVVDIVGTAAALDWLAPASVTCASVAMGHGTVKCAHGILPVPAPAALEVLREARGVMADGGAARELCTPTGAAILASSVTRWSAAPTSIALGVGWGAGDADLADRPNVLRVTALDANLGDASEVWQIDANLDDMSPELCGPAAEAVFAAGAVDVWWTPITMKKGRPALTLSALATDGAKDAVIAAILRETTTIGVRYTRMQRTVLSRTSVEVATRYGTIAVKVAHAGEAIANAAPEYEACAAAARAHGVPVKLVYAAALAAFDQLQR